MDSKNRNKIVNDNKESIFYPIIYVETINLDIITIILNMEPCK